MPSGHLGSMARTVVRLVSAYKTSSEEPLPHQIMIALAYMMLIYGELDDRRHLPGRAASRILPCKTERQVLPSILRICLGEGLSSI